MMDLREPVCHSHITDCLPDDHPLAYERVHCNKCGEMVHCENECMQTWFEVSHSAVLCGECFAEYLLKSNRVLP